MTTDIRYEIIIYWSQDDHAFLAEVPELPGCVADGTTYQEALAAVEVVIREWIETARERGRPVPEPAGVCSMPDAESQPRSGVSSDETPGARRRRCRFPQGRKTSGKAASKNQIQKALATGQGIRFQGLIWIALRGRIA